MATEIHILVDILEKLNAPNNVFMVFREHSMPPTP